MNLKEAQEILTEISLTQTDFLASLDAMDKIRGVNASTEIRILTTQMLIYIAQGDLPSAKACYDLLTNNGKAYGLSEYKIAQEMVKRS